MVSVDQLDDGDPITKMLLPVHWALNEPGFKDPEKKLKKIHLNRVKRRKHYNQPPPPAFKLDWPEKVKGLVAKWKNVKLSNDDDNDPNQLSAGDLLYESVMAIPVMTVCALCVMSNNVNIYLLLQQPIELYKLVQCIQNFFSLFKRWHARTRNVNDRVVNMANGWMIYETMQGGNPDISGSSLTVNVSFDNMIKTLKHIYEAWRNGCSDLTIVACVSPVYLTDNDHNYSTHQFM